MEDLLAAWRWPDPSLRRRRLSPGRRAFDETTCVSQARMMGFLGPHDGPKMAPTPPKSTALGLNLTKHRKVRRFDNLRRLAHPAPVMVMLKIKNLRPQQRCGAVKQS